MRDVHRRAGHDRLQPSGIGVSHARRDHSTAPAKPLCVYVGVFFADAALRESSNYASSGAERCTSPSGSQSPPRRDFPGSEVDHAIMLAFERTAESVLELRVIGAIEPKPDFCESFGQAPQSLCDVCVIYHALELVYRGQMKSTVGRKKWPRKASCVMLRISSLMRQRRARRE